jgi:hypothetical protein
LLRRWDGSSWGDVTKPINSPSGNDSQSFTDNFLGAGGVLESLPQSAKDFYNRNKDDIHKVGGGALIADGLVGFGANRAGIFEAIKLLIFSGVFLAVIIFGFLPEFQNSKINTPIDAKATVVSVAKIQILTGLLHAHQWLSFTLKLMSL